MAFLFTIEVTNLYTAKKMKQAAKLLGFRMVYQTVHTSAGTDVVACDFHTIG